MYIQFLYSCCSHISRLGLDTEALFVTLGGISVQYSYTTAQGSIYCLPSKVLPLFFPFQSLAGFRRDTATPSNPT